MPSIPSLHCTNLQEHLLSTFAIGDRKIDSAIKKSFLSEKEGYATLQSLLESNILQKELSREELPAKHPKQKLKKELRRYRIQNKIRFTKPFYRFYFRYVYPYQELLKKKEYEKLITIILDDLENYVSLIFEELSMELLKDRFPDTISFGSYWDRKVELDILLKTPQKVIVGECKWKNSRISKKILTSLQKKSALAGFEPNFYALFSKSGFSNELLKHPQKEVLLFDLEDFKTWAGKKLYKKKQKTPYSHTF